MLEGTGGDLYQGMLDTQLSQSLTGRPGGLGETIARQLMRSMRMDERDAAATPKVSGAGLDRALSALRAGGSGPAAGAPEAADADGGEPPSGQVAAAAAAAAMARARAEAAAVRREPIGGMPTIGGPDAVPTPAPGAARPGQAAFVGRVWDAAQAAERSTGVPAGFIVGQAALESGWGRHEIRHPDGRSAHNLFGVKAGAGWNGPTVEATTTEYVGGRPVKVVERFRAYASHEESFSDWARLMSSNPRYAGVLRAGGSIEGFAQNLQRAGYATDPDYASKLTRTITQALGLRRTTT